MKNFKDNLERIKQKLKDFLLTWQSSICKFSSETFKTVVNFWVANVQPVVAKVISWLENFKKK